MKITTWCASKDQMCTLGRLTWSVPRLFELARQLRVMDVPLDHLNVYYTYKKLTLREMVMHTRLFALTKTQAPTRLNTAANAGNNRREPAGRTSG